MKNSEDLLIDELGLEEFDGKRPVFLTVLCILTWVGCFLIIISGLFVFSMMSTAEKIGESVSANSLNAELNNMYNWMKIAQYLSLAGAALCLTGSLFMFNRKKFGFYIYVLGQIVPFISVYFTFGVGNNEFISTELQFFQLFIQAAIPIGFVIMYGLNLKYMNK